MISTFHFTGYGMYLPPNIETAEDLAPKLNRSVNWVRSRAGVYERRVSSIDVDEMAAIAVKQAIGNKKKPDLIINASGVPKQVIPDTSIFIQKQLGYSGIPSFSVHATCLSFCLAKEIASINSAPGCKSSVIPSFLCSDANILWAIINGAFPSLMTLSKLSLSRRLFSESALNLLSHNSTATISGFHCSISDLTNSTESLLT